MRLPDRVTGSFLVVLGAAAAYGGWLLPPVPGQPVGPNIFPLVIGSGLDGQPAQIEADAVDTDGGGHGERRPRVAQGQP